MRTGFKNTPHSVLGEYNTDTILGGWVSYTIVIKWGGQNARETRVEY